MFFADVTEVASQRLGNSLIIPSDRSHANFFVQYLGITGFSVLLII
jgi:hypothetical protein